MINVLVLGSGGREHALSWKLAQSPQLANLFVAPGNGGTQNTGTNVNLDISDFDSIGKFCLQNKVQLVVVGPEAPLVAGIADYFQQTAALRHIRVLGPGAVGARLEGSKQFAKEFMARHQIPTAKSFRVQQENYDAGIEFLKKQQSPYVLKADGLAAGKGVLILSDFQEAARALANMLEGQFGKASETVVIEEFLQGLELSVFVLTDGKDYAMLPAAKDYKRIGEGDTGLNTGGMGAVSPVPFADEAFMKKVEENIVRPTVKGIQKEGIAYKGFLFFGLMKSRDEPYVIEYNVRMGDPEAEVVIPRLDTDLLQLLWDTAGGQLNKQTVAIRQEAAATVMWVSGGYPGSYTKGYPVSIPKNFPQGVQLFQAGTKIDEEGILTNGGRVLAITALAPEWQKALAKVYDQAQTVSFQDAYYRKDIGFDL